MVPRLFLRPSKVFIFIVGLCTYLSIKVMLVSLDKPPPVSYENPDTERLQYISAPLFNLTQEHHVPKVANGTATTSVCNSGLLGVPNLLKAATSCVKCQQVTCIDILHGTPDAATYDLLRNYMKQHPYSVKSEDTFLEMTKDCTEFKNKRRYHLLPTNQEEADLPLAFNILMHKDVEQVERLLRAIYRPQNVYCIHVDGKAATSIHKAMAAIVQCFPNVFIATKLERVTYAGFSRLQADVNCMQDMMKVPIQWKYLINTAAQAFPLKTNSELVKVLKIYNGSNDIEGIYGAKVRRSRFENEWMEMRVDTDNPRMEKTDRRNPAPPDDIDIVRGSAYGVFSRDFVEFLVTDQKAKNLLEWSRKTYSPDEHYWATLHHTHSNPHMKPPGGFSGIPNEKPWLAVYAAWGGVDKCGGMWKHGSCVFGISDLPLLMERREHFANKFYIDNQPLTLDCLEAWIEHKVQCPPDFDYDYYRQLPFVHKGDSL